MTEVWAKHGPLAGRRVDVPEADVDAATGKSGWAQKLEPGTELIVDQSVPFDKSWKIPGYEPPPEANGNGKVKDSTAKATAAKETTTAKDAPKEPEPNPAPAAKTTAKK